MLFSCLVGLAILCLVLMPFITEVSERKRRPSKGFTPPVNHWPID